MPLPADVFCRDGWRGLASVGKTAAFLKFGVIASLVLVFAGRADAQMGVERVTLAAEQQAPAQAQSAEKAAAQERFQACVKDARASHDASWASECKRIGDKDRQDYNNCLAKLDLPKAYCDASYTIHDDSPNCTLPPATASVLDADLEQARYRCLRNSEAAWQ